MEIKAWIPFLGVLIAFVAFLVNTFQTKEDTQMIVDILDQRISDLENR